MLARNLIGVILITVLGMVTLASTSSTTAHAQTNIPLTMSKNDVMAQTVITELAAKVIILANQ